MKIVETCVEASTISVFGTVLNDVKMRNLWMLKVEPFAVSLLSFCKILQSREASLHELHGSSRIFMLPRRILIGSMNLTSLEMMWKSYIKKSLKMS